jgi:hypothetical protein
MPLGEDMTGTAFQVLLEMLSLFDRLERHIDLDLPRHELRSVWALPGVMIHEPLAEVCSMTNLTPVRMTQLWITYV